jgi:hypothetical protein
MAKTTPIDEHQLRALHQEGLSLPAIARRLHTSKAAVGWRVKALGLDKETPESTEGAPTVDSTPAADVGEAPPDAFAEVLAWWRDRQAALHEASDASRQTERTTFHVEHRWVEAIRRQADLDGLTYTQVVNAAFRQYFQGMSTGGGPAVDAPGAPGPDAPLESWAVATLEAATERVKAELRAAVPRPEAADDLEDMDLDPAPHAEEEAVAPPAKAKRGRRAP